MEPLPARPCRDRRPDAPIHQPSTRAAQGGARERPGAAAGNLAGAEGLAGARPWALWAWDTSQGGAFAPP
jgi:hypothetical protein